MNVESYVVYIELKIIILTASFVGHCEYFAIKFNIIILSFLLWFFVLANLGTGELPKSVLTYSRLMNYHFPDITKANKNILNSFKSIFIPCLKYPSNKALFF